MTLPIVGFQSEAIEQMRDLIAACPTFMGLVNATAPEQAKRFTYFGGLFESGDPDSTRALVRIGDGTSIEWESSTGFSLMCAIQVGFEMFVPASYIERFDSALQWFLNQTGRIIPEMLRLCREDPGAYPNIVGAVESFMPGIYEPAEQQGATIGAAEWVFTARGGFAWS